MLVLKLQSYLCLISDVAKRPKGDQASFGNNDGVNLFQAIYCIKLIIEQRKTLLIPIKTNPTFSTIWNKYYFDVVDSEDKYKLVKDEDIFFLTFWVEVFYVIYQIKICFLDDW